MIDYVLAILGVAPAIFGIWLFVRKRPEPTKWERVAFGICAVLGILSQISSVAWKQHNADLAAATEAAHTTEEKEWHVKQEGYQQAEKEWRQKEDVAAAGQRQLLTLSSTKIDKVVDLVRALSAPSLSKSTSIESPNERTTFIRQLTSLYILSHDGISSEMMAGFQLPPENWLNEQLAKYGKRWRVRSVSGSNFETYDIR